MDQQQAQSQGPQQRQLQEERAFHEEKQAKGQSDKSAAATMACCKKALTLMRK